MPEGATSGTALGLAVAGVAALFIISGVQKKSLGNILQGDIGEMTPAKEAVAGEEEKKTEEGYHAAINPLLAGNGFFSPDQHTRELAHGVEVALHYKEQLEQEITTGKITQSKGEQLFQQKYPYYKVWTEELKKATEHAK